MKAQFTVVIEGNWMYNGKPATAAMVGKELREAVKSQFEFLADRATVKRATPATVKTAEKKPLTRCAANRDGDCVHSECPQLRDNEPHATGRHCPIDTSSEDEQ